MKKTEIKEILEKVKSRALSFLSEDHTSWNTNDPLGLANENLKAVELIQGIDYILSEIEYIDGSESEFEILKRGEFQKYIAISNLLRREDIKKMSSCWRELFGNIEHMDVLYDETFYKMGVLSIYKAPPVYVIYVDKI